MIISRRLAKKRPSTGPASYAVYRWFSTAPSLTPEAERRVETREPNSGNTPSTATTSLPCIRNVSSRQHLVPRRPTVRNLKPSEPSPRPVQSPPRAHGLDPPHGQRREITKRLKKVSRPPKRPTFKSKSHVMPNPEQKAAGAKALAISRKMSLPTSAWVEISGIPPLSTLDDMLRSLENALNSEYERGIVDLDAPLDPESKDEPLLQLDLSSTDWVQSAQLLLASDYRPRGWRIQFLNRSIVQALVQYHRKAGLKCAWKPVTITLGSKNGRKNNKQDANLPFPVSDSMIRVDNCQEDMTLDHVRHLFRRFDLTFDGTTVMEHTYVVDGSTEKIFVVNFQDPSWARAAVREQQGVLVGLRNIRLIQFPRQILS